MKKTTTKNTLKAIIETQKREEQLLKTMDKMINLMLDQDYQIKVLSVFVLFLYLIVLAQAVGWI